MNKVIHLSTSADTSTYMYTQVYAGVQGTIVLNGTSVTIAAQSTIDIQVLSITGTAGIYVLGFKKVGNSPTQING